ncbi:MAG TPA: 2-amino-4-hydroxy-6-hydroxymethyldihydropteridine diphosphokinase [Longimicrobium sp.]|jgi:2-amino-4-hydroxy-6-hydroxymethyldihydropteridine diphosphokinase|uniref:2-amino-4-hydroxy-6- hydroxymethyldihydropteridine diphosphokinase n=1 Tax=Longimicrobium sp. TaxID=2029185 RepID=UPI002EDA3538
MSDPPDDVVVLGLGANLGDPLAQLGRAVDALSSLMTIGRVSSVHRTEPVGYRDQPDFYNLVVMGTAPGEPEDLLRAVLEVERSLGRVRTFADAPRTIDIDLLAFGRRVMEVPGLTLPHPRMHQRRFVLRPLAEIAPEWRHPVLGQTARELLSSGSARERVELVGPLRPLPGALAPGLPSG